MRWLRLLPLCLSLWVSSGCVQGGFRHYDAIPNCIPNPQTGECIGTTKTGHFVIQFNDPNFGKQVCFDQKDFAAHEAACHAK